MRLFTESTIESGKFYVSATLRDTLLPKLIAGELRVKDAERFINDSLQ